MRLKADIEEGYDDAVRIGNNCLIYANIWALNGKVMIHKNTLATGAFYGEKVWIDMDVTLTLDSYFDFFSTGLAKRTRWVEPDMTPLPEKYTLHQNYPNPFNPNTTIAYDLPEEGMVTIRIYNMVGQEVATLVNNRQEAGRYKVVFNAENRSSGIYFVMMHSGSFQSVKKMVLIK